MIVPYLKWPGRIETFYSGSPVVVVLNRFLLVLCMSESLGLAFWSEAIFELFFLSLEKVGGKKEDVGE